MTVRAPAMRRGRGAAAVALLALAATACGDADGVSLLEPERGLQGMWVRYQPPPPPGLPVALPRPVDDTLFLGNDMRGQWSREVPNSMGIEPLRVTELVAVKQEGLLLFLYTLQAPCPACDNRVPFRLSGLGVLEPFRLRRTDEDHLVIEPFPQAAPGIVRYHYERRRFDYPMPD